VVYALFSTLLEALEVKIGVRIDNIENTILGEFSDFTEKVLGLSEDVSERYQDARIYRVGVTNAADRGLDMWGNFGVVIQIKHISLTPLNGGTHSQRNFRRQNNHYLQGM